MKHIAALTLAILLVFSLFSCAGNGSEPLISGTDSVTDSPESKETDADTATTAPEDDEGRFSFKIRTARNMESGIDEPYYSNKTVSLALKEGRNEACLHSRHPPTSHLLRRYFRGIRPPPLQDHLGIQAYT